MPIYKCEVCHHEWEGHNPKCDWCGGDSYILEEKTPVEKLVDYLLSEEGKAFFEYGDLMKQCDCKEKVLLEAGDGLFIAYESWCPKHGYYTSCYICNHSAKTTEVCKIHILKEKNDSN